jgi:Icc-related predicted phosphoesterase
MRILYTSDLHGRKHFYDRAFELIKQEKIDAFINGGDILAKEGSFADSIQTQRRALETYLIPRLRQGKEGNPDGRIFLMMGNDDWAANMDLLEEEEKRGTFNLLHQRTYILESVGAIHELPLHLTGYGNVPITPFSLKDWERWDDHSRPLLREGLRAYQSWGKKFVPIDPYKDITGTIAEELEQVVKLSPPDKTIYITHSPPFDTNLDRISQRMGVGSKSVREFILKYQPPLTLHGHIHESPRMSGSYKDKLGKTICVNPGQVETELSAVIFDTEDIEGSLRHTVYG